MAFKGGSRLGPPPESPEALYRDLPRRPDAVPGLLLHQGDILREYAAKHTNTTDLALELPTGTGKTIPGLLIVDWVRRVRRMRTVYACPTRQLARQVAGVATREGIPFALLIGSHHDWSPTDETRYAGAEAVAVTTYSSIFNSSPKLAPADLLLFDDAHAGEQLADPGESHRAAVAEDPRVPLVLVPFGLGAATVSTRSGHALASRRGSRR